MAYDLNYHKATIYKTQPTSTGHVMVLSTGCSIIDESIFKTTAVSTAIPNYGVTRFKCTAASFLNAPVKGAKKTIIFYGSTKAMKIKTSGAYINNSTDDVITVTFGTTKAMQAGLEVNLYGYSTVLWYMGACGSTNAVLTLTSTT